MPRLRLSSKKRAAIRSATARKVRTSRPKTRRGKGGASRGRKTDMAVVVETTESPIITDATGVYALNFTTQLSDFNRAQEVAHAYKFYRCAKVELIFVPYATNSFTAGAAQARMPQLYYTLDRVANMWMAPTEAEMLERGISPRLFKSTSKFSYRPNLLQHVQLETNQPQDGGGNPLGINAMNAINSIPLFNKWLPTQQSAAYTGQIGGNLQLGQKAVQPASNPYTLKYYGSVAVIDIEGANQASQIGDLMTKVTWEFKGPRALVTARPGNEPYYSPSTSTQNPGVVANTQPTTYP